MTHPQIHDEICQHVFDEYDGKVIDYHYVACAECKRSWRVLRVDHSP